MMNDVAQKNIPLGMRRGSNRPSDHPKVQIIRRDLFFPVRDGRRTAEKTFVQTARRRIAQTTFGHQSSDDSIYDFSMQLCRYIMVEEMEGRIRKEIG